MTEQRLNMTKDERAQSFPMENVNLSNVIMSNVFWQDFKSQMDTSSKRKVKEAYNYALETYYGEKAWFIKLKELLRMNQEDSNGNTLNDDMNYSITDDSINTLLQQHGYEPVTESKGQVTKSQVKNDIIDETGLRDYDFNNAKNLPQIQLNRLNPLRIAEMVFGKNTGAKINANFIQPMVENNARKVRFLKQERSEITALGIKPRSKESAAVQKYGEKQWLNSKTHEMLPYTLDDLKVEFPTKWETIKNAADVLRGKYDMYLDFVNNELQNNGYEPIAKRKDYFLHFKELGVLAEVSGIGSVNKKISTDMIGLTYLYKPGRKFMSSQLQRRGVYTDYDAISGIDKYLEQIGDVIYHTRDIQKLRVLDNYIRKQFSIKRLDENPSTREKQLIKASHLNTFVSWLTEYTNIIAGKQAMADRGGEQIMGRGIHSALMTLKKQVGGNLVGMNPGSALSNFISVTQGAAKTNKIALIKGITKTFRNMFFDDGLMNKSLFVINALLFIKPSS
ncbi:MAG: hypothetical protein HGA35_07290, partial [Erysipelotrichaceae bacterium]|nr:hypothetical protein [Erysipelotrichaceae bacterium]